MSTAPAPRAERAPQASTGRPVAVAEGDAATPPSGADLTNWVRSGAYGTDGRRTWRFDETKGRWQLLVSAHVRFLAERSAAPDPDFPERDEDGEDASLEAGADVAVTVEAAGLVRTKVYRNMLTSSLRKLAFLDRFGASAWRHASTSADGKAQLFRAFNDLSGEYGVETREFYAVTGWHPAPAGSGEVFVHGGGVIGAGGLVESAEVRVGDQLSLLTLGEPAAGQNLVEAWAAIAELVTVGAMPGRVLYPLLAGALRPLFGMYRDPRDQASATEAGAALWVSGNTGGGKSGATAAAANAVYPGIAYNRFPFKAGSARNGGASGPGLERLGFRARDLALPFDDLDPSEPDQVRAAWQSDLLRRAFGQYARVMATQKGQTNRAGLPWRAGVIGTGEPLDAEASAENRALNVPIGPGDIRVGVLREHTGAEVRAIRGRLGAGLVRALAGDRDTYRARMAAARSGLRPLFLADGRDAPGPVARGADTLAEVAATLRVTLSILVDEGMPIADARQAWAEIVDALQNAWRAHLTVIGGGDRASRAIGYLSQALAAGQIRIDDKSEPGQPSRDFIGWRIRTGGGQFATPEPQPMAPTVAGYQDRETGDLFLLPSVATGAVKTVAERAGDSWTGSTRTIGEALKAAGYLHIPQGAAREQRATVKPPRGIKGLSSNSTVWHVLAERFANATDGTDYAGTDWSGPVEVAGLPCPGIDGDQADAAAELVDAAPAAAVTGCPMCAAGAAWCGPGQVWALSLPCEACGHPANTSARCGRIRHQDCTRPAETAVETPAAPAATVASAKRERSAQRATAAVPVVVVSTDAGEVERAAKALRDSGYPEVTEAQAAAAYGLFQEATGGVRLIGDPGFVGVQWFRWWRDRNGGSVKTDEMRSPLVDEISNGGDLFRYADHVRPGVAVAAEDRLTALDVVSAYLSGSTTAQLGHGEPSHHTSARDIRQITGQDKWTKRPGYARLAARPELVAPIGGLDRVDAGSWLPLPWLDFLVNPWTGGQLLAAPVKVDELVYWHQGEHGLRLKRWAEHVRDAEAQLKAMPGEAGRMARALVKLVRNAFLGGYLRSEKYNPTELVRLDWSDMVVAQTGANLARKVVRPVIDGTGPAPVGIFRDDVYYLADEAPPALDRWIGGGLGQLTVKGRMAVDGPLCDAIETGSAYEMSRAVAAILREV